MNLFHYGSHPFWDSSVQQLNRCFLPKKLYDLCTILPFLPIWPLGVENLLHLIYVGELREIQGGHKVSGGVERISEASWKGLHPKNQEGNHCRNQKRESLEQDMHLPLLILKWRTFLHSPGEKSMGQINIGSSCHFSSFPRRKCTQTESGGELGN